jgi:hypothetical protein
MADTRMCRVKLFLNAGDPESAAIVSRLENANVQYFAVPTSGPSTIWVDGIASRGREALGIAETIASAPAKLADHP